MNYRAIIYYIGHILRLEALFMLPAVLIAILRQEVSSTIGFAATIGGLLLLSALMLLRKPQKERGIYAREGFVTVALAWILMSLFGALPFYISGAIPSLIDCWFETVSGFTTTGATILSNVEALPMSMLYWRSFTHWLGGMGVLVFMLAIVPMSKGSGVSFHFLRAESPGPVTGKLVPKMLNSARILYTIYVVMTVVEIVLLLLGGMPLFDSVTTAFGTAGTGGFSVRNASIAAYDSFYLQGVVSVFMVLFGVNFNIFYLLLLGEVSQALRNEELRLYLGIIIVSTAAIAINISPLFGNAFEAFHHAFFQVSSIITTTGFATVDFNLWPEFSRFLLLLLMVVGACAGSTGGGVKVSRALIAWKSTRSEMQKLLHPRSVKVMKLDGKVLDDSVVRGVNVFLVSYALITILSMLLVSIDNYSSETTISSVLACIGNIGPGLHLVGPTGNYGMFSFFSKLILSLDMLLGRLEVFPILLLFSPAVWRRGR